MKEIRSAVKRAVLVAALLAVLAITVFAIPEVRDTFVRFFVQDEGNRYEFSVDPEQEATAPKYIRKTYRASYIPAGFTEMTEEFSLSAAAGIGWTRNRKHTSCLIRR